MNITMGERESVKEHIDGSVCVREREVMESYSENYSMKLSSLQFSKSHEALASNILYCPPSVAAGAHTLAAHE